jgi:hypothetical protein
MKLDFKELEKAILKSSAKSEYKQASIVILRKIFKEAESEQLILSGVMVSACKEGYLLKDSGCKKYGGICVKHNCDYWQAEP